MQNPAYNDMNIRKVERMPEGFSPVLLAVKAFRKVYKCDAEEHDPERAKALLKKVFGENSKYVWLKKDHRKHPVFQIDGIDLYFTEGATAEEDKFTVSYLGIRFPLAVRSLEGLGLALAFCFELTDFDVLLDDSEVIALEDFPDGAFGDVFDDNEA